MAKALEVKGGSINGKQRQKKCEETQEGTGEEAGSQEEIGEVTRAKSSYPDFPSP